MQGTNSEQIGRMCKDVRRHVLDRAQKVLEGMCRDLLGNAVKFREQAPGKHNFTGNFLNSIVVALYREGDFVSAYYSADVVGKGAIRVKMSATGKGRKRTYTFSPDYEGANSTYRASVKTDEGWGKNDARQFVQSYTPQKRLLFEIVVGYPVEYAEYIENMRQTAGVLNLWHEVDYTWTFILRRA